MPLTGICANAEADCWCSTLRAMELALEAALTCVQGLCSAARQSGRRQPSRLALEVPACTPHLGTQGASAGGRLAKLCATASLQMLLQRSVQVGCTANILAPRRSSGRFDGTSGRVPAAQAADCASVTHPSSEGPPRCWVSAAARASMWACTAEGRRPLAIRP